jgi:hypothetical protein
MSCNGLPVLSALNKFSVSRNHYVRITIIQVYHASVLREGPDVRRLLKRRGVRRSAEWVLGHRTRALSHLLS